MKFPIALVALAALFAAGAAQAHITVFQGTFGPEAAGATGTGTLRMEYDADGHTLLIDATFAGLSGNTSNAHIHCCNVAPLIASGVALGDTNSPAPNNNMLTGFPLNVKSGSYIRVIDLTLTNSYPATFITGSGGTTAGAENRLIAGLTNGTAYFNIHTSTFGGGEIRAFTTIVPEPGTWAMMAAGLVAVGGLARRRKPAAA